MSARDRGEAGTVQVFEAFLVAILVFTAMIFYTSVQRPTTGQDVLGIDLGRIAADTLDILQTRTFEDPDTGDDLAFVGWVNRTLAGDAAVQADVDEFLGEVLPSGTRYALRLSTGEERIHLLPAGDPPTPRAGRGAQTYFLPNWTAFDAQTFLSTTGEAWPGAALDFSTWTALTGPNNATTGPDGTTWLAWWDANEPDVGGAEKSHVPASVPYGTWQYAAPGACAAGCYLHLRLPDSERSDRPIYALELVVWFGA